jgi:hypothetical protein
VPCRAGPPPPPAPRPRLLANVLLLRPRAPFLGRPCSVWVEHLAAAVRAGQTSEANVTRSVRRAPRPPFAELS